MTAKIREEQVVLARHLEERTVETTASGSLRLASELPDAARVIRWRAHAFVDGVNPDPESGRVEASGRVRVWAVYVAGGSESADPAGAVFGGRLEGELSFTAWAGGPAFSPEALWDARVDVRDVDGRFRGDGRNADVDVVLQVSFSGLERARTTVVTYAAASSPCRVESTSIPLRTATLRATERRRISVSDSRAIPVPRDPEGRVRVIDAAATPTIAQVEVLPGSVAVTGTVLYEVLYAVSRSRPAAGSEGPGGEAAGSPGPAAEGSAPEGAEAAGQAAADRLWELGFASWVCEEPFRVELAIPEARPGDQVRARAAVSDVVARTVPAEGRVELAAEIQLDVGVYALLAFSVVTEIRGCDQIPVEQRKVSLSVESPAAETRRSFAASATLEIPSGLPPVERVLWCGVHLDARPPRVEGNRAFVNASGTPWLYYVPYKADARTGGLVYATWPGALTIEQVVPVPEARSQGQTQAFASFAGVSAEADLINRQTVELSVAGTVTLHARQTQEQEAVAEAVALRPRGTGVAPFFYLVVTQPGDTLWKLSRRYDTTPEAISQANPEVAGLEMSVPLPAGRRLFVARHG